MHGKIPGVSVNQLFPDRKSCRLAGLHRFDINGIAGYGGGQPAESIVVAGGYEDDDDYGDLIIYTGEGGNDPNTGKQVRDQEMTRGNLGLARNIDTGTPRQSHTECKYHRQRWTVQIRRTICGDRGRQTSRY